MYRSSYLREVRKEKYERSDAYDELPGFSEFDSLAQAQGLENLQDLNERFANYINRARVLEQRNSMLRKQLETFQRIDELAGLEEAFARQIEFNRQRIRELSTDRTKLEREEKDAQRMLDEFRYKYRNECEFQQKLKETLERLNKEADEALLCNLELQIESQFMQDDINSTKERHKKNLMEVQTYVNILQQIIQKTPRVSSVTAGVSEEKQLAERRIPILQGQLEEYKSILCQLQAQKSKLQNETTTLEQAIKNTQVSYDDEIQLYNEQLENLRKEIEEAEKTLEKYTNDCRQLVIYQQSLENELERYKRIIETEDNRLNSAIAGTPVTLLMQSYRPTQSSVSRERDITRVIQDIASVKPRQKGPPKKISRKKIMPKEIADNLATEKMPERTQEGFDQEELEYERQSSVKCEAEQEGLEIAEEEPAPEDVPDGAQLSKAFDKLRNIVKQRIRGYQKPEPKSDFYTKGRYVLVSGEGSYEDPCFHSSSIPAGGGITVSTGSEQTPSVSEVEPIPELPESPEPSEEEKRGDEVQIVSEPEDNLREKEKEEMSEEERKSEGEDEEPTKHPDFTEPEALPPPSPTDLPESGDAKKPQHDEDRRSGLPFGEVSLPGSMSYEKVEVVESIEKFSDDRIQTYEETAMIVETTIEKTSKKKLGDKGS
ncbi:PREDICTED: filensin [Gavialis gangeticus]|uniref:filensin n=1 Tax=Gavialis gangeticus TaxID=94835 RepID=UPI00092F7461|nr:PREDICTED: filensin [Gavialis gangeticus]